MLKRELPEELQAVKTIALYAKGEKVEGELVDHPAVLIIRGNQLYRNGDYKGAYAVYREAYSRDKGLIEAKVNMGFALVRLGRDDEARDIFEKLPEPYVNEYVLNELGNIYARKGFLDRAEEFYRRALSRDSSFSLAKLNLAMLMLTKGDAEEAYRLVREIKEIESEYKNYFFKVAALVEYRLGRVEDALNHIKKYIESTEDHTAWLLKAECEGALGNFVDAENSAKKSYELKPTTSAQIAISAFKLENGDVDGAIQIGEKVASKNVEDPRLFRTLARAYYMQEKYNLAYQYSTKALELRDMPLVRMIHGECARRMGRYSEALEDAERVLEHAPDYRNAKILKALALANLGNFDEALAMLSDAGGDDFLIHTAYAEVYALMGDKKSCADSLEKALKHRESVEHLRKLCLLLYELGEYERMEEYIKRLSDIQSKDAYVWFLRGEILFSSNPEEAEKYYLMAVDIDPNFSEPYLKLATIAVMRGDAEKLKEYMDKLVELGASAGMWGKILSTLLEHSYYEEVLNYIDRVVEDTKDEELRIYAVRALIALKRYEEAEALAGELVKKFPELNEAKLYLGISEYYLRKFGPAMSRFKKLTEIYELDANYYIARIHFDTGRAADALELTDKYGYDTRFMFLKMEILFSMKSYEELLEYISGVVTELKGKELTTALIYRMRTLFALGRDEEGIAVGLSILERSPDNVEVMLALAGKYYGEGDYENAEKYSAMALEHGAGAEALLLHARSLYMLGKYEDAIAELKKLIEGEEKEEYLLLGAEILYAMEKYDEARDMALKALGADDKSVKARVILGKIEFATGNYLDSAKYFEKVFFKDVGNYDALYHLSLCYTYLKEYEKAEKMFERAFEKYGERLSKEPVFVDAYATVLYALGKYGAVIRLLGDFGELTDSMLLTLGKAEYALKEYQEAEKSLKAIKTEEFVGEKIYYLTLSLMAENRFEEAEALLRELKEEKGEILYYHGLVLYNLGRYEEALGKFEAFIGEGGKNEELPYYMGATLYNLGRYEEALKYLEGGEKVSEKSFVYEAMCHYRLGHMSEAIRFFEVCVKKELMTGEMWFCYGDAIDTTGGDALKEYLQAWEEGYNEPELAFRLLKKYMEVEDYQSAAKYADAAAPAGDEARILGAKAYMHLNDPAHGYALIKDVEDPSVGVLKARFLIQLGRMEEAEAVLRGIPEEPEAAYELVKLLILRGKYQEAKDFLAQAEKFRPIPYEKMIVAYNMEDWEEALINAQLLIESGDKVGEASYIAGVSLYNLGKYDEAVEYLEKASGAERDFYLGMSYYKLEDYEHAAQYLTNVDSATKEFAMSLYNMGEFARALEVFESMDDEGSREYAGICAFRIGDYERAVKYLDGFDEHREMLAESYYMLEDYEKVVSLNPENMRILGMAHYRLGNMKEAAESLEALRDKNAEDYYYLALAQLRTGDYLAAEKSIENAKKLGYEGELSEFEGVIAYMKGDYRRAVELLRNTRDVDNLRMYGIALYHTGRYGEAAEVLKNYEDEESRGFYARALMEIGTDEALREAESIFTSLGDMGSAAACALKLGEYERVISYLKGQDDEESAGMKFEAYINLGRKEEAAGMYNKLPESVRAAYAKDMCAIFMELGRYSDAEVVLNTYFYEDHEWLMLKAKLSINRRDYEAAISSLRHAKKLNPHDAEVSRLLAPLLLNAGHESDALKEAKRAVKDFPDDAICWYNLGLAYHRTGNTKKAIEALQKSVSLDESLLEAWHLLGLIYLDSRDYENAYSALSRVKDRIEDRDVLMSLAMTAYQIEKYDEALGYIDRAISMSRDHMALYYRALILIELDREEEAMEDLKEAIEMNPGFVEARKLLGDIMGGE